MGSTNQGESRQRVGVGVAHLNIDPNALDTSQIFLNPDNLVSCKILMLYAERMN
jgi:hypothetical protein